MPEPTRTWTIRRFGELDSTNQFALAEASSGAADGLVVVADHQTAGRGRLGRTWEAPPGSSLLVSVLVRPVADESVHGVAMAAALAAADAVEAVAGFAPELKWPNDLLVGDRKLAGLLAERAGDAVVVGIGLNVQWDEFPDELAATATACNIEAGHPVDREAVLESFLAALAPRLDALGDVLDEYRNRLATLGRRVRVELPDGRVHVGLAVDLRASGVLVVRDDDGVDHEVASADVFHVRNV